MDFDIEKLLVSAKHWDGAGICDIVTIIRKTTASGFFLLISVIVIFVLLPSFLVIMVSSAVPLMSERLVLEKGDLPLNPMFINFSKSEEFNAISFVTQLTILEVSV